MSSRLKTKEAHYENDSGTQHSDIWISTANVLKTLVSETEKSWQVEGKRKGPQGHQARGYTKGSYCGVEGVPVWMCLHASLRSGEENSRLV